MTRSIPRCFDPSWYLEVYPDVARSGMDPGRHYRRYGQAEGRLPCALDAIWRERDLRWGLLEDGIGGLEALATAGSAPDRLWASIACAREAARRNDWAQASVWLEPFDPIKDLIEGFCDPDHALLGIEAAVLSGDFARAQTLVLAARRRFGPSNDLRLSHANLIAAQAGFDRAWHQAIRRLYRRHRLSAPRVRAGDAPVFDRLVPTVRCPSERGPMVSVIMPAFNAADTIETALRSLCGQTWRNLEILVVDNGSTDGTRDVVGRIARDDPRIELLDGSAERGAYPARNLGAQVATGRFITVLDADDWAHPARIARQVRTLRRHTGLSAVMSHWVRTTPDLRFTRWWKDAGLVHPDLSSLMIRAELRDSLGYWDRVRGGADTEYHDRIVARFGPRSVTEVLPGIPLGFGRLHDRSLTRMSDTSIESLVFGPRRSYAMTARRWHMQADFPLPARPHRRPFAAPGALALDAASPQMSEAAVETGLLDEAWYLRSYPDLRRRDVNALTHYRAQGAAEGRDPGPDFSTTGYAMAQGLGPEDALDHYIEIGRKRGLAPRPVWEGELPAPGSGKSLLFFAHQAHSELFGAERCLLSILRLAIKAGFTPSVMLPQIMNSDYLDALRACSHQVHVIPCGRLFGGVAPDQRTLAHLGALIGQSGAIEVHQNTVVLDAPLRAARMAGIPTIVHVHELPQTDPRLCMDLGLNAAALRAHLLGLGDRFIANSQAVLDWLSLPGQRAQLMPGPVDQSLFEMDFAPADPPRVALIGALTARKGIADFIEVARIFARQGGRAAFRLIGPASADLAALGPLPANVRHMGYAPTPHAAMEQADLVLSLSHVAESYGLCVAEALCAGRPVICYDRGTPPDLVGRGEAGRVVRADDPGAVADALWELLRDRAILKAHSRAARRRAQSLRQAMIEQEPANLFGVF